MASDEALSLAVPADERDPDDDVDTLLALKPLLPKAYTNNWAQGLRVISLQADNWNGLLARQCSVVKLNLRKWGLQSSLAQLVPHLSEMRALESLTLDENLDLTGTLADLSPLVKLRVLSLSLSSRVQGALSDLSDLVDLRALFLEGTKVTGNLRDLSGCVHLTVVALSHTEVTGPLYAVARWPELRWLLLSGTRVAGETIAANSAKLRKQVAALGNLSWTCHFVKVLLCCSPCSPCDLLFACARVRVRYVACPGNLTAVSRSLKLERLQLNDVPNVSGQVAALAGLAELQGLGLAHTGAGGELMSLAGLVQLRGLRLDGSKVRQKIPRSRS